MTEYIGKYVDSYDMCQRIKNQTEVLVVKIEEGRLILFYFFFYFLFSFFIYFFIFYF